MVVVTQSTIELITLYTMIQVGPLVKISVVHHLIQSFNIERFSTGDLVGEKGAAAVGH